jgi:hypothetical protein
MAPRRLVELYRVAVVLGAAGLFLAGLPHLGVHLTEWWPGAVPASAGILAGQFPLRISLSQKVSVDSAVFFAAVLLLPAWQAAATVARDAGDRRRDRRSRKMRASKEAADG